MKISGLCCSKPTLGFCAMAGESKHWRRVRWFLGFSGKAFLSFHSWWNLRMGGFWLMQIYTNGRTRSHIRESFTQLGAWKESCWISVLLHKARGSWEDHQGILSWGEWSSDQHWSNWKFSSNHWKGKILNLFGLLMNLLDWAKTELDENAHCYSWYSLHDHYIVLLFQGWLIVLNLLIAFSILDTAGGDRTDMGEHILENERRSRYW